MIIEGDFFFQGIPRWNLGWPTPNYAGAFLVTLICFTWAVGGPLRWRLTALAIEGAVYFPLAKTYSRGALVAWMMASLFFIGALGWRHFKCDWHRWGLRIVMLSGCVLGTGFSGRVQLPAITGDDSVLNRIDLWRGGLEMIAAAPLHGWGAGESGRAYMNWFQDIDRTEGYTTMVNSYLQVSVEYGLGLLALVLCGPAILLWISLRGASVAGRDEADGSKAASVVLAACGASLVAWATANVFTTLWIEPRLWVGPVISAMVILIVARRAGGQEWLRATGIGFVGGICVAITIYFTGIWLAYARPLKVAPTIERAVTLVRAGAGPAVPTCHIWSDPEVLGTTPGRELRRWISGGGHARFLVHREGDSPLDLTDGSDRVVLFGRHVARFDAGKYAAKQVCLIHPLLPPPNARQPVARGQTVVLVLPGIDERGLNESWRAWGEAVGAQVIVSPNVGHDIRSVWPEVMLSMEQS